MKKLLLITILITMTSTSFAQDIGTQKCSYVINNMNNPDISSSITTKITQNSDGLTPNYLPKPPSQVYENISHAFSNNIILTCKNNLNESFDDVIKESHDTISGMMLKIISKGEDHRLELAQSKSDNLPKDTLCKDAISDKVLRGTIQPFMHTIGNYILIPTVFNGPGADITQMEAHESIIATDVISACKKYPDSKFYNIMNEKIATDVKRTQDTIRDNQIRDVILKIK